MSTVQKTNTISPAEYFAILDKDNQRYELIDGEIYAMAGGSRSHTRLIRKLSTVLDAHLQNGTCEVFPEFMLRMEHDNYVFPDLLVECDNEDNLHDYATHPVLIIEVLSDSTRRYDLSGKFNRYQSISSLQEYVVVEQSMMRIYIYRRADEWNITRYEQGDEVEFQSIGLTIPIADIYERILFAEDIMAKQNHLVRDVKTNK